jgi:hypothetical protein
MNFFLSGLLFGVFAFVVSLLGAAVGAVVGWIVGLLFDESIALLAQALGVPTAQPYQIGAMLGFVSGFFRSTSFDKG